MTTAIELVNMLAGTVAARQGATAAINACSNEEACTHLESAMAAVDLAEVAIITRLVQTPLRSRDDIAAVAAAVAVLAETTKWVSHGALLSAHVSEALLTLSAPSTVAA